MIGRRSRPPSPAAVGLVLLLVAVLLGCGLPSDNQPRPIADEAIPNGLESADSSVPAIAATGRTEDIFVVEAVETEDGTTPRLAAFPVELSGETQPEDLLDALLDAQPGTINEALSTAIPDELQLHLDFEGSTAIISLSEEFQNVEGEPQKLAFAQLVFTVTELERVDAVEFRNIDSDESLLVPTDDDSKVRVDRSDFAQFAPEVTEKAERD